MLGLRTALVIVLAVGTSACKTTGEPKPAPEVVVQATDAGARKPTDVTFLVASDTHFGFGGLAAVNEAIVASANAVEGMTWPAEIGGKVATPRGMVVTGDLTEWGDKADWDAFEATYVNKLRMPVFEMPGNHDKVHGRFIDAEVIRRHGAPFYSWDWDGLHLVSLNEAPDDAGIAFLKKDLAAVPKDAPVAIFLHLALDGPWSTDNWFANGPFKDQLAAALEGHRVAGIFHGHHHARGQYTWRGQRVYKPGAAKHDSHSLLVVRVTGSWIATAWLDFDKRAWVASSQTVF